MKEKMAATAAEQKKNEKGGGLTVRELIEHLKTLNPDLPVYVREQNPHSDGDYWEMTPADIISGNVEDLEREKEIPAVLIGDDRV